MLRIRKRHFKKIAIITGLVIIGLSIYTYLDIRYSLIENQEMCFEQLAAKAESGQSPELIYKADFAKLQILVEASLSARAQMLEVANRLKENEDEPLHSRDLLVLRTGTEDYLELREELYTIANTYYCITDIEESTLLEYNVDPELRLKGSLLALSAALTLYDNYLIGTILFEQDGRLRKIINDPDMGFGIISNKLMEMTLAANSIENRHRIRKVIAFYEEEKSNMNTDDEDSDLAYLELLIESSPSYNYVKKVRIGEIASKKFVAFERITADIIAESSKDGFDLLSGIFGNTIGIYESRKGKLYGNTEVLENIQANLQPLDILVEKTPFRLTDKLIPGHFGHVAVWTGTKAELIDIGLWDDLNVKEYADQINSEDPNSKDEHQIIEALRSGVQLSQLEHFLNIDDFAILRPIFEEGREEELKKEALLMAFRQLGKTYDFNFDVNTTDKIVCSELAYVSFPSIDWPTEKTLGRYSISPDNVAKLAWTNVPLELIMFYHDGKLVEENIQLDKMIELMQR